MTIWDVLLLYFYIAAFFGMGYVLGTSDRDPWSPA